MENVMNIDHAKSISMLEILEKLNITPHKVSATKVLFSSPLRKEKTPSFYVYRKTNSWYDYGEAAGGDLIAFVCHYLRSCKESNTIPDALRWIKNMAGDNYTVYFLPLDSQRETEDDPVLLLKSKKVIQHLALVQYLENRGIGLRLAQKHLKEVQVHNKETKKNIFALGFLNEDGGYEIRNPFFKGSFKPKAITFIRGKKPKPEGIHLFEGFMDYLSAVHDVDGQAFEEDTIVLNSISCIKQAFAYIHNYGYKAAYTWMDNDNAGRKADIILGEFFKTEDDIRHIKMNRMYAPHKDVNAWHMHKHNLSLPGLNIT